MDIEYLQNVMGSPYVTEGAFDRLKARGAQAMGAIGATAGYQIKNPTATRIQSLWWGFVASLNRVMMDWKNQVSPMLGPDVKIPVEVRRIKKSLDAIAQTLTPNPYINQTTKTNPNLKTLTKEGLWDAAKRDMGLNKALASNNPTSILNSYKNHVLSLFQNFMKDAVKSTKLPPKEIYSILAKIQPKENGWQATANMQTIVKQLQKLQTPAVPTTTPPPSSTATQTPPVAQVAPITTPVSTQQPSAAVAGSAAPSPTSTVAQPQNIPNTQTPPSQPNDAYSELPSAGPNDIPSTDMPYIILKALKIIVDAVKTDEDHALGLFGTTDPKTKVKSGYPKLATGWGGGPSVTSSLQEAHANPKPKTGYGNYLDPDAEAKKKADDEIKYKEYPGEFLYNFWSRYSKQPGAPFAIQVTSPNVSPEIEQLKNTKIEVWWNTKGGVNKIYVIEDKDGKKSKPSLIMEFSDLEVYPKTGATTPGNPNFFSVEKIVQNSNPFVQSKLSAAPPEVMNQIKGMEDDVLRALLATTQRKNMEFKSKAWALKKAEEKANQQVTAEKETSAIGEDGSITYTDDATKQKISVSQDEIRKILKGPMEPASLMRKRLETFGYFDKFPDSMPPISSETEIWKDARMALMTLGYTKNKADILLSQAWQYIKNNNPNASIWAEDANISTEFLVDKALKKKPVEKPSSTPPTSNSVSTTTPTQSVTSPVSKPAGEAPTENPVSAPVSGGASAPVTKQVAKPVSNNPIEPTKPQGKVELNGNDLTWEHPKTHEVHTISADQVEKFAKKQPKFVQALKDNPELYAKFKALNQKKSEGGDQQKVQERIEYINPFSPENFL